MVNFASRLVGMACQAAGLDHCLMPIKTTRKLYSTMCIGFSSNPNASANSRARQRMVSEVLDSLLAQAR